MRIFLLTLKKQGRKVSFYLLPQAGIGGPFYYRHSYPRGKTKEPHFIPNISIGLNF